MKEELVRSVPNVLKVRPAAGFKMNSAAARRFVCIHLDAEIKSSLQKCLIIFDLHLNCVNYESIYYVYHMSDFIYNALTIRRTTPLP